MHKLEDKYQNHHCDTHLAGLAHRHLLPVETSAPHSYHLLYHRVLFQKALVIV